MKKLWLLLALGIGAFLIFAVATLPAGVIFDRLTSLGVRAGGVEGTAWRGRAQVLQFANANLGAIQWKLHVLPLFTARVVVDVKLTRSDGFAETQVALSSGSIRFEGLTASLPLSALPPTALPGGWIGAANMKFSHLTLEDGWPIGAEGTLDVVNLTGPARKPANIGSYRVSFPSPNASAQSGVLVGALTDQGGPLQIAGTLQLKADRSYLVEGLVATKPETPPDVANALQFLGAPDAQGRREFSLSGTM